MSDANFVVAIYRTDGRLKVVSGRTTVIDSMYGKGTHAWRRDGYEWNESERLRMKLEELGQEGLKQFIAAPTKTVDLKGGEDGDRRSSDQAKS